MWYIMMRSSHLGKSSHSINIITITTIIQSSPSPNQKEKKHSKVLHTVSIRFAAQQTPKISSALQPPVKMYATKFLLTALLAAGLSLSAPLSSDPALEARQLTCPPGSRIVRVGGVFRCLTPAPLAAAPVVQVSAFPEIVQVGAFDEPAPTPAPRRVPAGCRAVPGGGVICN